jgi:beta-mannosidase
MDPTRRFVATTSTGPRFTAEGRDFGKNLHWDVHGTWVVDKVDSEPWQEYWIQDDALFRSEMGHPGAQSAALIRHFLGDCDFRDASLDNPYWQRVSFWFDLDQFVAERGDEPWEIEDYVSWSQQRQGTKLAFAVKTLKARFPRCGGLILWMGHDSFPCPVNTSLLDFEGKPKPVCKSLMEVLRDHEI